MRGRIAAGAICAGLSLALTLGGCSSETVSTLSGASASTGDSTATTTASDTTGTTTGTTALTLDTASMFTDKDLSGNYENGSAVKIALADGASTSSSSNGVSIDGNTITISADGVYVVSGSLTDGQIVVNAGDSDKVQIVLDGATITNSTLPAILVTNADKTFVTVADGTTNTLSVTGAISQPDDEKADATIFSHDDLTINGTGTLTVNSAENHAIVSKDDLVCAGVTLNVTAAGSGLKANNSIRIASGTYDIDVDTDAIHADTNDDVLGYVYIADGTFTINAGDDAIHAEGATRVDGGTIDIQSCYEGLEGQTVAQTGGDVTIVSTDDGVNAASASTTTGTTDSGMGGAPSGGAIQDFHGGGSGMQGAPSDSGSAASGSAADGTTTSGSAADGSTTSGSTASGSTTSEAAAPGATTSDGSSSSAQGAMGGGMADTDDSCDVTISGGTLTITTGGDGLDSNGTLEVTGGTIDVWGPEDSGNGALDYGTSATISGGTVIAAGASGMAENFTDGSTQCSALVTLSGSAGDTITVTDSSGNVIMSGTTTKSYGTVVVSSPDMKTGETYTVSNGSTSTTVEMSSTVVGSDSGTMGGGMGAGQGGGSMGSGQMGSAPSGSGPMGSSGSSSSSSSSTSSSSSSSSSSNA